MKHPLFLLALIAIAGMLSYGAYRLWAKWIDPRRSFRYFLLYMLLVGGSMFLVISGMSYLVIHFKEFFFKK